MQYLGPKHFTITSNIIECRIKSGFAFTLQLFKIKKSNIIYNIFVICLEQFHNKTKYCEI